MCILLKIENFNGWMILRLQMYIFQNFLVENSKFAVDGVLDSVRQVFGEILLHSWKTKGFAGFLFNSWVPGTWNSYCFLANFESYTVKAFLNNKKIFENFQYDGQHLGNGTQVFLLNSKKSESPSYGSLTDLQIWDKTLSVAGIELLFKYTYGQFIFYI